MSNKRITIVVFIILGLLTRQNEGMRVRFTNFICNGTDPSYGHFDFCKIVPESRSVHYLTARGIIYQLPITNFHIRVQLLTRMTGWQPFLLDVAVKCNFTQHLNKLTSYGWSFVKMFTSIQHDCPYNESEYVMKRLDNSIFEDLDTLIPVPRGDYGFLITYATDNTPKFTIRLHLSLY